MENENAKNDAILKDCLADFNLFEKNLKDRNVEIKTIEAQITDDPDTPPVSADVDDLRIKYKQVLDQLFSPERSIVYSYCAFGDTDTGDADPFANSIITLFRAYGNHMKLLDQLIQREVDYTFDYTTVFRRNSMCTKMMTFFSKDTGQSYLVDVLGTACRQIFESHTEILEVEAGPLKTKGLPPENLPEYINNLLTRCQQILDSVISKIDSCPGSFRYICYYLKKNVKTKWPDGGDDPWLKAIVGFFFLRFVCPAVVTPEGIGVTPSPDNEQRRKFVLVAKVLQNLANATSFAGTVKELEPIDKWIKDNTERVSKFLNALAEPPEAFLPFVITSLVSGVDVLKSLAVLQQMTRVKMVKIMRVIDNGPQADRSAIRDILSFLNLLLKHDFNAMVLKMDPSFTIEGLSQKLLTDTINSETAFKKFDADLEVEKCLTLNWLSDPEDKFLRRVQKESRKEKKKEDKAEPTDQKSAPKEGEEEIEEDKGQLVPIKLLDPVMLSLRLLSMIVPILKGSQKEERLQEMRRSEKFKHFCSYAYRLQKCDIHSLPNNERKVFWLNIFHTLFLHSYLLVGFPAKGPLQKAGFYNIFQYKIGNHLYSLSDIIELLKGTANSGDDKYKYFDKTDMRRNMGVNGVDGRLFFAMSFFHQTSPKFNAYYTETIDQQLDKAVELVINELVDPDINSVTVRVPPLFETFEEELRLYAQKKFGVKKDQGTEWVKPLLTVNITEPGGETVIENCYTSIQKVTKSKPNVVFNNPETLQPKILLDVQFNLPEEPEQEVEEEKEKKGTKLKIKYDESGFPTVPWPEQKLDNMSKEELIEYIRLCKRALKQGGTIYATLKDKSDPYLDVKDAY